MKAYGKTIKEFSGSLMKYMFDMHIIYMVNYMIFNSLILNHHG